MIKTLKIIRDVLCFSGLIFLTRYAYDYYKFRQLPAKLTTTQKAVSAAKRSSNAVVDVVSGSFTALGNITKKARFKNARLQTESFQAADLRKASQQNNLTDLSRQAEYAYQYLKRDNTTADHEKNQFLGRLKEVTSQIEHLDKYIKKGPLVESEPANITNNTANNIYDKNIKRKSLALVNKMEILLTDIASEITGDTIESNRSMTFASGIAHNNDLLLTLVV